MRVSSVVPILEHTEIDRPHGPITDQMVGSVLKDVAVALWPTNTAAELASRVRCGVRTIERYFEGSREWSGDAIAAIVSEILKRHTMRNVKVRGRG